MGAGDDYLAKVGQQLTGGWGGPSEPQLGALAALLKAHSAESTALVAWLREDASSQGWLGALTGPEAQRPQQRLPWPYDTFAALHMQVLGAIARGSPGDAYDHQEKLVMAFLHAMEEEEFTWSQTVMVALYIDLRRLAVAADRHLKATGEKTKRCDQAADKLRQGFSKVSNDKGKDLSVSKKWSALHLINQIFKLLFSINQLSVGLKNLQRWVESPLCPNHTRPLEQRGFPKSQVVTYQYYSGRLALYEDDFETASRGLEWAFAHCHGGASKNKQAILRFLVPVQLLVGRLPSPELLHKYGLAAEYEDVVGAVRDGNIQQFEIAMAEQYERFIRDGVYLVLEKLRTVITRNLVKKIHLVAPAPAHQLKLSMLASTMHGMGQSGAASGTSGGEGEAEAMDLDELECTLANLIYSGYVKGYIAHEKRVLVLSKATPFPTARLAQPPKTVF